MPKLADVLCKNAKNSSVFDSQFFVRFAVNLQVDMSKASEMLKNRGVGYIYAASGFSMPDTPFYRRKMVANFGTCVVVGTDGEIRVITPQQIAKSKKPTKSIDTRERNESKRLRREHIERLECERMFRNGQGQACPKRGGKANSCADIGKYTNHMRKITMSDYEAWAEAHFYRVSI